MKRLLTVTTAALALGAPAFAQTSADIFVSQQLMERGYSAADIRTLTDVQVSELYLAMTSEDESDVSQLIATLPFADDVTTGLTDTGARDNTVRVVADALTQAGYPAGTVDMLSDTQVAELYLSATSGDAQAFEDALDSFQLNESAGVPADTSNADMYVMTELERRGVAPADIASLDSAELTQLYVALTSGDAGDVDEALASALN